MPIRSRGRSSSSAAVGMIFPGPYRLPNATFTTKCVFTNTPGRTAYRGPWQFETVAREMMLDIAARRLDVDPADLRRRNLLRSDEMPYANAVGMTYSDVTPLETFDLALEKIDYDEFRRVQAGGACRGPLPRHRYEHLRRTDGERHGPPGQRGRDDPGRADRHRQRVPGGRLGRQQPGDHGDPADRRCARRRHLDRPHDPGRHRAHAVRRRAPAAAAAARWSPVPSATRRRSCASGSRRSPPTCSRRRPTTSWSQAVSPRSRGRRRRASRWPRSPTSPTSARTSSRPTIPMGLEASARYRAEAFSIWANATHVCTCEVDIDTGHVELLRYVVAEDCGPMINPNVVEGQIAGGTVQGIGGVLLEDFPWDEEGNPLATTFVDYLLPTSTEVPTIEYVHTEGSPGPGPGGYKGVGEGGAIGAPAAVANAIADALAPLGVTITRLPLSPATIVALIDEASRDGGDDEAGTVRLPRARHDRRRPPAADRSRRRQGPRRWPELHPAAVDAPRRVRTRRRPPPCRGTPRHRANATDRCGSVRRPRRPRSSAMPRSRGSCRSWRAPSR